MAGNTSDELLLAMTVAALRPVFMAFLNGQSLQNSTFTPAGTFVISGSPKTDTIIIELVNTKGGKK